MSDWSTEWTTLEPVIILRWAGPNNQVAPVAVIIGPPGRAQVVYSETEPENPTLGLIWLEPTED